MKKLLLTLLALCLVLGCTAALAETSEGWTYSLNRDGTALITGYEGEETNLVFPETLDGYIVIGVGEDAFNGNTRIKQVTIPDSYTFLGANSFKNCSRLQFLSLGGGISDCESVRNRVSPRSDRHRHECLQRLHAAGCNLSAGIRYRSTRWCV